MVNSSFTVAAHTHALDKGTNRMSAWFRMALAASLMSIAASSAARAQDKGTLDPVALPPLTNATDPKLPAKEIFGRALSPTELQSRSIGFYARGCLAGAKALPVDGETWQVMRLSRNRNWANPAMISFLERFSKKAAQKGVWPGILVGDISQPRGGPMITGHASHQVGLDADIWLTPMPDRTLTRTEREEMSAVNMVTDDGLSVDRAHWTPRQAGIIQAAAEEPEVERIFVNAAIKKALCETARGQPWMTKVRAYWGHNYHFHVRIACPAGDSGCQPQEAVPAGDGCDKSLAWWFTDEALHPRVDPNAKPKPPITLAQMPPECRQVVLEK
jgi:penicillin-insensitive murein DD-endopeptidase